MSKISENEDEAINQIIEILNSKNYKYTNRNGKKNYYILFDGYLTLENYNSGRSKKGLLTTNNIKDNDDIKFNEILNWTEKFGKSKNRFQYNVLGKPKYNIQLIFEICNTINKMNKMTARYKSILP